MKNCKLNFNEENYLINQKNNNLFKRKKMKNIFKKFYILGFIVSLSSSFNQAFATYDATTTAPSSLAEARILVKTISDHSGSRATVTQKMLEQHSEDRGDQFTNKSFFSTKDITVLGKIYDLIVNSPARYVVKDGNHYFFRDINPNEVQLEGKNSLGNDGTGSSNKVLLVANGIVSSRTRDWSIAGAKVASVYLISNAEYNNLTDPTNKTKDYQ